MLSTPGVVNPADTTPVVGSISKGVTVAIPVYSLPQIPVTGLASFRVVVPPSHTLSIPVMGVSGLTVTVMDTPHAAKAPDTIGKL